MPDILVRDIDGALAERIMALARERKWSINDVILHALRHGLGLGGDDLSLREVNDIARLAGTWDHDEAAAFREAMQALEQIPESTLALLQAQAGAKPPGKQKPPGGKT